MTSTHPSIGPKIRYHRKQRGWSLRELEDRAGFPFSLISRWERRLADPDFGQSSKIAEAFGIPVEWLWDLSPAPKDPPQRARKEHVRA